MNPTDQSPLQFPCQFPIKVMGACADGFADAICTLVQQHDPGFDPKTLEMRPSKNGNYLGLTVTISAQSREQLDALYRALTSHPMVKVVL
jgi:putative lipoic acid-binding regulatory protein